MPSLDIPAPIEMSLDYIGVNLSRNDLERFASWAQQIALLKTTQHSVHDTTRDSRPFSIVRKIPMPFDMDSGLPQEYVDVAQEIYAQTMLPFGEYLGTDLQVLPTRYAAEVHVRKSTDGPGEGHTDYYPSCNIYFSDNEAGGDLVIARDANARTIDEIAKDAYRVAPRMGKVALFNGELVPHYVEAPTNDVSRVNLVIAYYYDKPTPDPRHPRHYQG